MPSPFFFRRVLAAEQSCPRLAQGRQGFALLITIVLMAFLVLIVVSMASLTRVETQIAANYQQLDSARQNALMALNIAVGQLQAAAGPDQRVTARAEILDSTPATATVDSVKQPYWTGVWKTGNAPLDVVISGINTTEQRKTSLGSTDPTLVGAPAVIAAKAAWLVSQPTPTTTIDPLTGNVNATTSLTVLDSLTEPSLSESAAISGVTTDSVAPNAVILAKQVGRKDPSALPNVTLPDGTKNRGFIVAAPLVTLTGNVAGFNSAIPIGKYAYWVADEGVKAKANLIDPTLGVSATAAATATTAQAHFLAPQANALHKVAGLVTPTVTDFRSDNTAAQVSKVIVPNSLAFLPTTPAGLNIKPYLTDITTYSRGVLADVKNGGLKKDLTSAFESTTGYNKLTGVSPDYGYGQKMLYRNYNGLTLPFSAAPNAAAYDGRTDGLPWAALYTYYNTYKSALVAPSGLTTSGGPITPTTTGSLTSLPYQMTPRVLNIKASTGNTKYGGLVPEVISFRMDIALGSYLPNPVLPVSPTNPYKLCLRYYPQLVLYNPYNCRLSTTGFDMRRDFRAFLDQLRPYRITVTVGGTVVASNIVLNPMLYGAFSLGNSSAAGSTATLEPGETRVFGLVQDIQMVDAVDPTKPSLAKAITCTTLTSTGMIVPEAAQWTDLPVSVTQVVDPVVAYTNGAAYAGTDTGTAAVTVSLSTLNVGTNTNVAIQNFYSDSGYNYILKTCLWPNVDNLNRTVMTSGTNLSYSPPNWASLPISSLSTPRMLAGLFFRKKGLVTSSPSASFQNGTVVIPSFHGNAPGFSIFDNLLSNSWGDFSYGKFGTPFTSSTEITQIPVTPSGPWETYFGNESVGKGSGTAVRKVLRDVPGQPMVSLGQFMHMPIVVTSNDNTSPLTSNRINYGVRDNGSMFIGGSFCNPFVPTDATLAEWPSAYKSLNLDDSYLANDTLFDRFYFSTVPPSVLNANATPQWTSFNNNNTGTSLSDPAPVFPNARIQPYARNGVAPTLADLRDFDQAAANLLLDGAFNVNSTSIDAWKALLSSLSGNDLQVFRSVSGTAGTISASTLKNPIPRFWASAATGAVNQAWEGARALSDAEVTQLATRIVEQVKTRGPFLSMSDFLNRRLGTASAMTRVGALQAAIDNSTLNDAVKLVGATVNPSGKGTMGGNAPSVITTNLIDGAGNTLNSTVGMPGYLMQQDVVQAFSAAMTVRSDTFTIRTYGESINPATGVAQAKAWAEAVVQRLPEFVDPSTTTGDSDPTTAIASLSSTTNQNMGRRFKVIGFRWLSPSDL